MPSPSANHLLLVLALFSWAGCAPSGLSGPITRPDAGAGIDPPSPDPLTRGAPITSVSISLGTASTAVAAEDFVLEADGRAAYTSGSTVGAAVETGALWSAARVGDEQVVAAERGLFVAGEQALLPSPLGAAFGAEAIARLASGASGALFARSSTSLYLYAAGVGRAVRVPGLDVSSAELAYGGPVAGIPALWVTTPAGIAGLVFDGDEVRAYPERSEAGGRSLGVDAAGTVWAIAAARLLRRLPEGRWIEETALAEPQVLAVSPDGRGVWIANAEGIWQHHQGVLSRIDPSPAERLIAGQEGLVAITSGQARLILPGVELAVFGLGDGETLSAARAVVADAGGRAVSAEVDGAPIAGQPFRTGIKLTLSMSGLSSGPHTLRLRAGPIERSLAFHLVDPAVPTWSRDISAIYQARCAECHNPSGNAHNLSTADRWRGEIDRILSAVREHRMPLPPKAPLDMTTIDQIEAWQAAQYPN